MIPHSHIPGGNSLSPRLTFGLFVHLVQRQIPGKEWDLNASLFHNRMHSSEVDNHKQMTTS